MVTYLNIILLVMLVSMLSFSAFLSASETAITGASKAKLHHLTKQGNERAKIVRKLQKNTSLVLASILIGNITLNNFSTSMITTMCNNLFGEVVGAVIVPLCMSLLIVVYVEVLPKLIAVQNPESFLIKAAPLIKHIFTILRPLTKIVHGIAHVTLKIFGFKEHTMGSEQATLEELKGAIDLHHGSSRNVSLEKAMLKSILDLGSVHVSEIMTHRKNVSMINVDDPLSVIIDQALSSPFTRIPLWKENVDNIVGVINVKTLLRAFHLNKSEEFDILSVASRAWFVPESTNLFEQLQAFRQRHEHFGLVVDEYGSFMGIVTLEDILEEIVGEIFDEHDISVKGVRPQPDGSYVVDGSVTIRDLNRQFDWNLKDEPASTIAGLLLYQIKSIPDVGQVFIIDNFRFEVLRRQRNQITLIRVSPPPKNTDEY